MRLTTVSINFRIFLIPMVGMVGKRGGNDWKRRIMKIKYKVFKRKSGKSKGKWIARVDYFDEKSGRFRSIERSRDLKAAAVDERDRLVNEINKSHGQIQLGERMNFEKLANICSERFYGPAVIVEGRKLEGVRAYNTAQNHIKVLKQFFGKQRIGSITVETLREYRRWRLKIGSRHPSIKKGEKKEISLATINRELSAMRRMMRFAYGEGWVTRDVFFNAGMIDGSAENPRDQMLSEAEERRLLNACQGERQKTYTRVRFGKNETITANVSAENPHLKAIILLALDAGMRRGEILKLRWQDIDFEANIIRVLGINTKTEKERVAPLTDRAKAELNRIRPFSRGDRPFPFSDFKRSWATAKEIAGIQDLHFHDLRRTAITRWVMDGNPIALAGKIAGHTQIQTTMRHYTNADEEIVRGFTEKMNAKHARTEQSQLADEFLN
jgi:integrase